jgi:hypothetical protein
LKKYTAKIDRTNFILFSEDDIEVGRIVSTAKILYQTYYIQLDFQKYDIKTVGLFSNSLEVFDKDRVVYFTDLGKNRIIRSGNTKIYTYKFGRKNRLFHKENLLIEIRREKKWFKAPVYYVEVDDSVEDLLTLLFLFYSDRDFNMIGAGGD